MVEMTLYLSVYLKIDEGEIVDNVGALSMDFE